MIDIFFEEIEPLTELNPDFYESWLDQVANLEKKKLGDISLIFTSDEHLLTVNQQYLDHDYYTDIITFDYSEDGSIQERIVFLPFSRMIRITGDMHVNSERLSTTQFL